MNKVRLIYSVGSSDFPSHSHPKEPAYLTAYHTTLHPGNGKSLPDPNDVITKTEVYR